MADQLTPFLTGAYGHKVVKTPNLDKLVEEGIRFDAAYTPCPLCTPARASLMTGKYASSLGCYDNASPFSSEEPTFCHYLATAGYETVLSGKMHFVGADQLHGYEKRLTTDFYPSSFAWLPEIEDEEKGLLRGGNHARMYKIPNVGVRNWSRGLTYDEETHYRALEYIHDKALRYEKPFFLTVSYHHPHDPFYVTQELWDLYEGEEIDIPTFPENLQENYSTMDKWLNYGYHHTDTYDIKGPESLKAMRRSYYGLITYIDHKVGELMKALEDSGLSENTIIIFTSDHGDMLGERDMVQKRTFYEWSCRVPLIIKYPDQWQKGKKIKEPVSLVDLLPSFLDMAGVDKDNRAKIDGKSFIGLIDGSDKDEKEVFSEYEGEGVIKPCFMFLKGKYKYVYIYQHESQLFDTEKDPEEMSNLSGLEEYRELEEAMKKRIFETFDPEKIHKSVTESYIKRRIIKEAMKITGTAWDYSPYVDASKQYHR